MNETTTQAIHELLLGVNKQLQHLTEHLTVIVAQLQDQKTSEGSPRLGFCSECVMDWLQAGSPAEARIPSAISWIATPAGYPMPGCIRHLKELRGSQLILPGR